MPIFDFRCGKCSATFELLVLSSTTAACPQCGSPDLEKLISGFAVSSAGISQANIQAARRRTAASASYKDQKKAEAEGIAASIKEHG